MGGGGIGAEDHLVARQHVHWYESASPFMLPVWSVFGAVDLDVIEERLPVFSLLMWFYMLISVGSSCVLAMLRPTPPREGGGRSASHRPA